MTSAFPAEVFDRFSVYIILLHLCAKLSCNSTKNRDRDYTDEKGGFVSGFGTYHLGETAELMAVADEQYKFDGWYSES